MSSELKEQVVGETVGASEVEVNSVVSTGNNGTTEATTETATDVAEPKGDIAEASPPNPLLRALPLSNDGQTYYLTVDQIDPNVFENSRTSFDAVKIQELRHSFSYENGQIQEISVSRQPDGRIGIGAGYTRHEAFSQNVYDPLIKKWNREHDLKSADANFLLITNPTHREMVKNAYPNLFSKEKNKTHNLIRCNFKDQDKLSAMVDNYKENSERQDLSVAEEVNFIEKMIASGIKAADLARKIKGLRPSVISYMRKVGRIPESLKVILVTPDLNADGTPAETFTESDLTKLKEQTVELVAEFERRMGLHKDDPEAISISHLKEFSARVVKDASEQLPLSRKQIFELTCELCGADAKTAKISKTAKKAPLNFSVFVTKLKMAEAETKARREGKHPDQTDSSESVAEKVEGAATVLTDTPENIKAGTIDGLAAQQAAGVKSVEATTDKADTVTTSAAAAEANADVAVKPVPGATQISSDATAAALVGADLATLDDDVEEDENLSSVSAADTGRKRQTAPTAMAKQKSVDYVLSAVDNYKAAALQEETEDMSPNPILQAAALGSIILGLDSLSLSKEQQIFQTGLDDFAQQWADYVTQLEEFVERAGKKAKLVFTGERPMLLLGGNDEVESGGDDADSEVVAEAFDEEGDAPSSEDLEAIEDMLDGTGEESDDLTS